MTFQTKPLNTEMMSGRRHSPATITGGAPLPLAHVHQEIDEASASFWSFFRAETGLCFSSAMLRDLTAMQMTLPSIQAARVAAGKNPLRYYVTGSHLPGVFNLGGDLALFMRAIRAGDRDGLRAYGQLCIEAVYNVYVAARLPLTTIMLVQGEALGGGFEAALSADIIVAERRARFGLPEILFNLFPGMGAMSFLSRRLDATRAEKIILSGKVYTAEEMHAMGIVDILAEDGFGEEAVRDYIAGEARRYNAHYAIRQAKKRANPVTFEELSDIVELWVDSALRLEESDLRRMARLVAAQEKRQGKSAHPMHVAAE